MLPMREGWTDEQTTSEDRATQLLICEPLSFAIGGCLKGSAPLMVFGLVLVHYVKGQ